MSDGKAELAFLRGVVRDAWQECAGTTLHTRGKGSFDLVTDLDFAMERFITAALNKNFAGDIVIGEELNPLKELPEGRVWTVDPIDGTVNMAHGLPLFGVQCSFSEGGAPVASVIFLPRFDELYSALRGGGAWLNGERISVSGLPAEQCVVSVGDYSHKTPRHAVRQIERVTNMFDRVTKLRHFGAASVDFAWFASGRTDGFVMYTRNLWDILPGWLLAKEAGAVVLSADGGEYNLHEEGIAVCASQSLAQVFEDTVPTAK